MVDIDSLSNPKIRKACVEYLTGLLKKADAEVLVEVIYSSITHQYRITTKLYRKFDPGDFARVGRSIGRLEKSSLVEKVKDQWATHPETQRAVRVLRPTPKGRTIVETALNADEVATKVGLSHKGNIVVGALIEMEEMENKILIVRLGEGSPYPGKMCLPGGLCRLDETPIEGLTRRVKKTIGVDISLERKRPIFDELSESSIFVYLPARVVVYWCNIAKGTPHVVEGEDQYAMEDGQMLKLKREIIGIEYKTPSEIVYDPHIVDSIARCLLWYYKGRIEL